MTLVSEIISRSPQADGRLAVVERHIADDGRVWQVNYIAASAADLDSFMSMRAAGIIEADAGIAET